MSKRTFYININKNKTIFYKNRKRIDACYLVPATT